MFFLDRPNSKEPTFIFLRLTCVDGRLKYPVKKKVEPTNWSGKVIKDTGKINLLLNRIEAVVKNLELQRDLNGTPLTKAMVENALNKALGRETAGKKFFEVVDEIISDRATGKELTPRGKRFSYHTIKGYKHSRDNLQKFMPAMTFEGITMKTYDALISYFYEHHDHSLNSLGKTIKNWKVFLKAANKRGAHSNLVYLNEDFRVPGEDTDDVYLDDKELAKVYKQNFPNKTLDIARDWFIIDCFTGLRISDIKLMGANNILDNTIRIVNEKTGTKVEIPINSYIRAILKKWKGLPPRITDQEMNRSIKEVCELAGITGTVLYSITKGGVRHDFHYKKFEMVSNHTARRCFITNLLNDHTPDNVVMQLAGIKKHATLMKYKKTRPEKTAEIMQGKSIFK
jgi:integrase